ncbi:MAG: ABC transporter ATP-binding protein/permease [Agathobacter sp.]|nr:ABC transporter ATP-binding protein/permease [Agathobacter sp.]
MLQLKNISKTYHTGDLVQNALDNVSLNFRDNEFVSILGQSGSGKTTLLNIIGGLDHYDSGELIIDGVSTRKYLDGDWDTYRNHTIGFVFQNYNLISHQSILSNVELALTISGVSGKERKQRAKDVLAKVGLLEQMHKKPAQLSGGQMQRVAIARALVNEPKILLADEPTGALDSNTSIQIMELLKEVAKDRLVIMVTHNPELAKAYSSRIVTVKDGKIINDTAPFEISENAPVKEVRFGKKSSMSFQTAIKLSFQNLRTKKGRTILTAFAGSIGIIGIAIILALSTGVNDYIMSVQKDTMSSYPIEIESKTVDFGKMMSDDMESIDDEDGDNTSDGKIRSDATNFEMQSELATMFKENNLKAFKEYLEKDDNEISKYASKNGIVYRYDTSFSAYTKDSDGIMINTDGSGLLTNDSTNSYESQDESMSISTEDLADGESIFTEVHDNFLSTGFEIVEGTFPEKENEAVLILDSNGKIALENMYKLGMLPSKEYQGLVDTVNSGEKFKSQEYEWEYKDLIGKEFYIVPACDLTAKTTDDCYEMIDSNSKDAIKKAKKAFTLKVTAIVKPTSEDSIAEGVVGYTSALTKYLMDYTGKSDVIKAQKSNEKVNIFTGLENSQSSLESTYESLGYATIDNPTNIRIYVDNFENKEMVTKGIDAYNKEVDSVDKISYSDLMDVMISSVTTIVDVISYILIGFVAISLVVSSLMIGIITYISVLERTREIGILRALGATKRNIKNVFNAETILIGFAAGVVGIVFAEGIIGIINTIIKAFAEGAAVKATLPVVDMIILILLSMFLTFIGGCIPSRKAAKKDPVEALRSE